MLAILITLIRRRYIKVTSYFTYYSFGKSKLCCETIWLCCILLYIYCFQWLSANQTSTWKPNERKVCTNERNVQNWNQNNLLFCNKIFMTVNMYRKFSFFMSPLNFLTFIVKNDLYWKCWIIIMWVMNTGCPAWATINHLSGSISTIHYPDHFSSLYPAPLKANVL